MDIDILILFNVIFVCFLYLPITSVIPSILLIGFNYEPFEIMVIFKFF